MSPRSLSALIVSGLISCAFAHDAVAAGTVTATIDLVTDQAKPCTITTTDPLGLHLEQNGTNFTANPATLTGTGCGTGATTQKYPPTTPFILTPTPNPLTATVGQAFTVSWIITGGTTPITCTGSFSGAPAGAALTAWTQAATAVVGTNTRSVTPTAADTGNSTTAVSFNLAMTCSNADGSITSSALPITINPASVPDSCPSGRLMKAPSPGLCYKSPNGNCTVDSGADNLATFPIWIGRYRGTGGITPAAPPYLDFPGASGAGPSFQITPTQYVSALFTVPTTNPVGKIGQIVKAAGNIQTTGYTASNADVSISTTCGDFDSANIPTACKRTNVSNDATAIRWIVGMDGGSNVCRLDYGQNYYLNVRTNGCTASVCTLRIDD